MTSAVGRSLELYYIDGRPDGMVTAELFNWTGHVLLTPRTQMAAALQRDEATYSGIYLLLGEKDGEPCAYIGESEDVGGRIRQHDVHKDWWTQAVLVTASANKLNKAHVRYLESRLIAEARAIGRVPMDNATTPPRPSLSEADIAKMEAFLDNLLVVLPAVRVDMFIRRARPAIAQNHVGLSSNTQPEPASDWARSTSPRFLLQTRKHGLSASAVLRDGEFIVEQGSTARSSWVGFETHNYAQLHSELLRGGIITPQGDHCIFTQSYAFTSPSAAAAVIFGRSASGPAAWRLEGRDITYKDWEMQQLSQGGGADG